MAETKRQSKPKSRSSQKPAGAERPPEKPPETAVEPVRTPKVYAGQCPTHAGHEHTAVYKTEGRTRYCKCNDCGATWKRQGEYADELREYLHTLCASLDDAERVELPEGGLGIVMRDRDAREISERLKKLAG